jgi:hypothetical protein
MLLTQDSGWDMFAIRVHDRGAEDTFRLEYALPRDGAERDAESRT